MIRPSTKMLVLLGLLLIPALLPAMGVPALWPLWVALLGLLVLAFAIDAALLPRARRFKLEAEPPSRVYIGEPETLLVRFQNTMARPWPLELKVDSDPQLEVAHPAAETLPSGDSEQAWAVRAKRRGDFKIYRIWMRWPGPLGLALRTVTQHDELVFPVVPNTRAVKAAAIRFFNDPNFLSGLKVERYAGDGSEFDNLREFLPGMDHRHLDWKASARHRKLLVREFRAERNHQVIFALDTGHTMSEPIAGLSRLDHSVNSALLLAYCVLKTGDRAALFAFDDAVRLYSAAEAGVHSIQHLQQKAAEIEYGSAETNFTLGLTDLATRLKRRSLVILFTEFNDTIGAELMVENLSRLSARHVVIFVTMRDPDLEDLSRARPEGDLALNRAVVATDILRERRKVLSKLERFGIHTIDVHPRELSAALISEYLTIKRRELV
ncbi:MAG: DUF58 domain-containing protein [Planctomycetota bacterium]